MNTCWYVLRAIKKELTSWRNQRKVPTIDWYPTELQDAIIEQRQIGWKNFLEGLISERWTQYMQQYLNDQHSKYSANLWTARLIKYNLEGLNAIWTKRNNQLHNTDRIRELEGIDLLKTSIETEWNIGLGQLAASEFLQYFRGE